MKSPTILFQGCAEPRGITSLLPSGFHHLANIRPVIRQKNSRDEKEERRSLPRFIPYVGDVVTSLKNTRSFGCCSTLLVERLAYPHLDHLFLRAQPAAFQRFLQLPEIGPREPSRAVVPQRVTLSPARYGVRETRTRGTSHWRNLATAAASNAAAVIKRRDVGIMCGSFYR